LAILRGVVGARSDRSITERILNVLRPYASNWNGTLGRGDLVIPQREIPRVIHELLDALHDDVAARKEAGDRELFDVLKAGRRSESRRFEGATRRAVLQAPACRRSRGAARPRSWGSASRPRARCFTPAHSASRWTP